MLIVKLIDLNILDVIMIFKCMYYVCINGYVILKKMFVGFF